MPTVSNSDHKARPVIGLVGGVCSGKSTAAEELAALGCVVIDADRLGHQALRAPEVREQIRRRWGDGVMTADGQVDRRALGRIVFANCDELTALTAITWPRIREGIERGIAEVQVDSAAPAVVVDAAVLFEAGWNELCTHVLFVDTPEAKRVARAAAKGWSEQSWRRRENSQFPLDMKSRQCYASLDNSSTVSHLREQTRQAFYRIVQDSDGS